MKIPHITKEKLGAFGEWAAYFGPLIIMFGFFYQQNASLGARIDATGLRIDAMGARIDATLVRMDAKTDELHRRCDVLHQEFLQSVAELHRRNDVLHEEFVAILKDRRSDKT